MAIFFSCENRKIVMEEDQKILDLPEESVDGSFTKHFEIESIVPIETDDELLISRIRRIIIYKDKFIILSAPCLIGVIDSQTGKKELVINQRGNGPGESINILDITIDEQSEHILVLNDSKKLLFFDFKGNFLKAELVNDLWENIIYDKGKVIFHNMLTGDAIYPYLFEVYDLKTKKCERTGIAEGIDFMYKNYGRYIVKSKNIWFSSWLGYKICILKNDSITVPYILNPKNPVTDELAKKQRSNPQEFYREIGERKIICAVSSIRETDNFLVFKSSGNIFIVDKSTSSIYREPHVFDKNTGFLMPNYFPHNGDDGRIMFIIQPNEWLHRHPISLDNVSEHIKETIETLKVDEHDNPILVFYKEKKK
jgi:hypothetical protein